MFWLIPVGVTLVAGAAYALLESEASSSRASSERKLRETERQIDRHRKDLNRHLKSADSIYRDAEHRANLKALEKLRKQTGRLLKDAILSVDTVSESLTKLERQIAGKRDILDSMHNHKGRRLLKREIDDLHTCRQGLVAQKTDLTRQRRDLSDRLESIKKQELELKERMHQ